MILCGGGKGRRGFLGRERNGWSVWKKKFLIWGFFFFYTIYIKHLIRSILHNTHPAPSPSSSFPHTSTPPSSFLHPSTPAPSKNPWLGKSLPLPTHNIPSYAPPPPISPSHPSPPLPTPSRGGKNSSGYGYLGRNGKEGGGMVAARDRGKGYVWGCARWVKWVCGDEWDGWDMYLVR